nr:hypothetical protein [Candidatus Sigynarchaeota archaeon]
MKKSVRFGKVALIVIIVSVGASISAILAMYLGSGLHHDNPFFKNSQYDVLENSMQNVNDFQVRQAKIANVTSGASLTTKIEHKGWSWVGPVNGTWNGSLYVLSIQHSIVHEYPEAFINSVYFRIQMLRGGAQSACDFDFWNHTSSAFQRNNSVVSGFQTNLEPDFYKDGDFTFKFTTSSVDSFAIIYSCDVDFNISVYIGQPVIMYKDLGPALRISYENLTCPANLTFLSISVAWSQSTDNTTWTAWQIASAFAGDGSRFLRFNVSVQVFAASYLIDAINVTFQNCSQYYFTADIARACWNNNTIQNATGLLLNVTVLPMMNFSVLTISSFFIYNCTQETWNLLGPLPFGSAGNLVLADYLSPVDGIRFRVTASAPDNWAIHFMLVVTAFEPAPI